MAERMHGTGWLLDPDDGSPVAEVSCLLVVRDLGRWQGSLTVRSEQKPVMQRWLSGQREYLLDLVGIGTGSVALDPMEWLDPACRGSYTYRGLSLPPGRRQP